MRVIIGSRAIKTWFKDFPREPKDYDYATDEVSEVKVIRSGEDGDGRVLEFYPIAPIIDYYNEQNPQVGIWTAEPDVLYTLKVSHVFWDIKWKKTMFDIWWLQKEGCKLDMTLFWKLYYYWCGVHGVPKRANLYMSVEKFFDNGIKNGHNHDNLHKLLKESPTYTKILIDPDGVAIDEKKWEALPLEDKLNIIREEVSVMAYERLAGRDYRTAYSEQLKAWILVHAPTVKMALVAIENFEALRKPLINYKEHLDENIHRIQDRV